MYQVSDVLQKINANVPMMVLLALFPWVGGFVQIVEALRIGFRQRMAGQPLATTMVMIAHDGTFLFSYDHYVNQVHHPYFTLFWCGMGPSVLIELVLLYQWVKFRSPGFGGGLSTPAVLAVLAVYQGTAFALWWWFQSIIADPLNLIGFTVVQTAAVVFVLPMALGRGNARGQSRVFAWATLLGPASLGMLFIPYLVPALANWHFFLLVAGTTACGIAYLVVYERYRRRSAFSAS